MSLLALPVSVNAGDAGKINMACGNFPPFKIEHGEQPGIDVEVMKAAWAHSDRTVAFDYFPWKRSFRMVETGAADGLCGCSYRPEREQMFHFTDEIGQLVQGVFVSEDNSGMSINTVADLKGMGLATVRGYAVEKELKEKNLPYTAVVDNKILAGMLLNNRVDAIYGYQAVIEYELAKTGSNRNFKFREISRQPAYLCISRAVPGGVKIVDDFNKGLRAIKYDGTYQSIWNKYLLVN